MKKVLVLAALAALVSTSAFAGSATISGTKHNLRSGASNTNSVKSGNLDEICAFCHTPHAANTAAATFKAPLWNRSLTLGGAITTYTSTTLGATAKAAASINSSDAVLCLSCHDGSSLGGALVNNPNVLNGAAVTISGTLSTGANIGVDLTNDHPVGFNFATAVTEESELKAPTDAKVKVNFGTSNNDMWCSSCHDVHNNTNEPFLVISNAGSALCLQCHSK